MSDAELDKKTELKPFNQRVKDLVDQTNPSKAAKHIGISQQWMLKILNGSQPGLDTVIKIAEGFDVSLEWLITGKEPMRPNSLLPSMVSENTIYIELLPFMASAGNGQLVQDEPSDAIPIRSELFKEINLNPKHTVALRVRGDSMEPTLKDGALILIDKTRPTLTDNAILAFSIGDEMFVKRLRASPAGWRVISDNAPDAAFDLPMDDSVRIIGRVRWAENRF